ncbi:hypothetical protein AAMO2058_001007500 [Amorphochlora amoebiformis]
MAVVPRGRRIFALRRRIKTPDGRTIRRGTVMVQHTGHTFGMVPARFIAVSLVKFSKVSKTWRVSRSFLAIEEADLTPLDPIIRPFKKPLFHPVQHQIQDTFPTTNEIAAILPTDIDSYNCIHPHLSNHLFPASPSLNLRRILEIGR